jgi:hypothetical protein
MVQQGVKEATRHFFMQTCHVGFRQLSWTYDKRVKAEVNKDSDLLVIPNGMTKRLPPLDIVINRPFKIAFWQLYNQQMTTTKHELMPSG